MLGDRDAGGINAHLSPPSVRSAQSGQFCGGCSEIILCQSFVNRSILNVSGCAGESGGKERETQKGRGGVIGRSHIEGLIEDA